MRALSRIVSRLFWMWFAVAGLAAGASDAPRVVAYVPNWVDLGTFSGKIDYSRLSHINIAFENPVDVQGNLSFNLKDAVLIEKARANKVKVLVSIGGGSASTDKTLMERYFTLLRPTNRVDFAAKLADYVEAHGFDGLDVDIEGPSINADYGGFIAELSRALKSKGKLLTAALSKGYGGNRVPDGVFSNLDFVNIMAYDGTGSWAPEAPGQHSSLEFARDNTAYWLGRGLPKSKAVLGVPFYGYGFGKAFRNGSYAYSEIVAAYPGAENMDQAGETIWHNGIPTIKAKAQYVLAEGLGGMMIWSLDNDVPGGKSLLAAMTDSLTAGRALEGKPAARFHVLAFHPKETEQAHMSFIVEANRWFSQVARENHFSYESTTDWNRLNPDVLSNIQVVVFLDQRAEAPAQRQAFEAYMKRGGGWMGFHFAGFALTPSEFPQNWDWYHQEFLGSGSYAGNTWRPTAAILRAENRSHPALKGLPETFKASPNEWYKWENDLRKNPDIQILLAVDPASFPLGTGPKPHEIWHEGYYPMVWTNIKYRMIYFNMGHNDLDFDSKPNKELSHSFDNPDQNHLILNSLLWLGGVRPE